MKNTLDTLIMIIVKLVIQFVIALATLWHMFKKPKPKASTPNTDEVPRMYPTNFED